MSNIVKEINLEDGNVLKVYHDEFSINPRSNDNMSTIAVFHNQYDFGDNVDFNAEMFESFAEMKEYIEKEEHPLAILPVYMYQHSGVTINTTGFSCPWDSGQVGFVYTTQKHLDMVGITFNEDESWVEFVERLQQMLVSEIKELDHYISGEAYGFENEKLMI